MVSRFFRYLLASGLVLAVAALVRRTMSLRDESLHAVASPDPWLPIREAEAALAPAPVWLPPAGDGSPPGTHPIKAKAASGIYHLPGMLNYQRTKPDRCYATEAAAEADGYVKAKR